MTRHATLARVPGRGTQQRTVRVSDELWEAARAAAKRRGESLSDVLRAALERYITEASERPDADAR